MADFIPSSPGFLQAYSQLGFSKKFNFRIESIDPLPPGVVFPGTGDVSGFTYINSLSLPSRKINTTTVPYKGFDFVIPTTASYSDNTSWQITVMSDSKLLYRDFFEKWSRALYDEKKQISNGQGNTAFTLALTEKGDISTAFSRPRGTVNFQALTEEQNNPYSPYAQVVRKYTLHGIFPTMVGGITYDVTLGSTQANFASFNVTFAYQYFTTEKVNVTPAAAGAGAAAATPAAAPQPFNAQFPRTQFNFNSGPTKLLETYSPPGR